jgi:hypothetical protein
VELSLDQFDAALDIRDQGGRPYLLIGGQAVYFWATSYVAQEPTLEQWRPFTSKDIDFHGGREDLVRFAQQLGVTPRFPHRKQMTAWAGVVEISAAGVRTSVDFLRLMPGIRVRDAVRFAVERDFLGRRLRVLDPISLLICKANLALKVDQKARRDAEHVRIMVLCVRAFLREGLRGVESGEISERGWLNAVKRVLKLVESTLGRKATRTLGVDWTQALPLLEIATSTQRAVIQLREKRLPQCQAKLARAP